MAGRIALHLNICSVLFFVPRAINGRTLILDAYLCVAGIRLASPNVLFVRLDVFNTNKVTVSGETIVYQRSRMKETRALSVHGECT